MILIVEDEPSLAVLLQEYLQHNGLTSAVVSDGAIAIEAIKHHQPRLIILDLMLPNKSGLDIYRELRTFSQIPVVMATAKVDEIDRLIGLELGADDYICKPYSPREVVARVKNVLRRSQASQTVLNSEDIPCVAESQQKLSLNEMQMRARIDGEIVSLTPAEFKLLLHLSDHADVVFNRDQLIDRIYSDGRVVTDRTIDSHIKNLRKKILAINPEYDWIKSVYGVGYRFELERV